MSKKLIAISLAILVVGLFSTVALAGVEGSFTFDIHMWPQENDSQYAKMDFDFEGLLDLNLTLSGLTFSHDLAVGIAGIEHYIADLDTTLGALTLKDEFVFAAPYIDCASRAVYGSFQWPGYTDMTTYSCKKIGDLLFVKKRVNAEITLAGLSLETLVLFEDTTFPAPTQTAPASYDPADQNFGFGGIVTISGETVSGIKVTSKTGLNALWTKYILSPLTVYPEFYDLVTFNYYTNDIKKARWYEVVDDTEFDFSKEAVYIEGITVGDVTFNSYWFWEPDTTQTPYHGLSSYLNAKFKAFGFLDLDLWLSTSNITSLTMSPGWYLFSAGPASVLWVDDGDLTVNSGDTLAGALELSIQKATFTTLIEDTPGTGITDLRITGEIPVGDFTLTNTVRFTGGPPVEMDEFEFTLDGTVGGIDLTVDSDWAIDGLKAANFRIGIPFSL